MEIVELLLRLFILAARLHQRDLRGIEIPPGNSTLFEKLLAAVVDLLLCV